MEERETLHFAAIHWLYAVYVNLACERMFRMIWDDQVVDDDLHAPPLLTCLRILPAGGVQPALDIHAAALVQVLRADLCHLAPDSTTRPLGVGLHLAIAVRPGAIGRHAERRAGGTMLG